MDSNLSCLNLVVVGLVLVVGPCSGLFLNVGVDLHSGLNLCLYCLSSSSSLCFSISMSLSSSSCWSFS